MVVVCSLSSLNQAPLPMKRTLIWSSLATSLFVIAIVFKTLADAGHFRTIDPIGPADCERIEGIVGGEDLHWRQDHREVFVSSFDRRKPDTVGAIFLVRPFETPRQVIDVTPELPFPFRPHGLYLWSTPEGSERLFVVNHRSHSEHTIEIFDVASSGSLVHQRSIADDLLTSPNDIVAVGPEQFYVTNDHGSRSSAGKLLETYLQLPLGNVLFYDGSGFRISHRRTKYANGINIGHDGTRLYLSETVGRRVTAFDRDPQTHALVVTDVLDAKTGVDNIDVAPDGSLWIAAHPRLLEFGPHARDAARRSSAEVLRLVDLPGQGLTASTVYLNDGHAISAPATAAVRNGLMLIGPVFDPFVLACPMPDRF
jgi:arylesterase / paraoxonase